MRISIVTGSFMSLPPAPCGAVERLWHDLGLEFARRGHSITFLARGDPNLPTHVVDGGITYIRRGLWKRSGRLPIDLLTDLGYSLQIFKDLPEADILVVNCFWMPVLARLNRRAGKVVVNLQRYPKGQMWLYRKSARLAAASQAVMDAAIEQSPSVKPITRVIPNFVDTTVFQPPVQPRRYDGDQILLYTGRVHPEKGIHVLVDAFSMISKEFPKLRLRIVGPTEVRDGGGDPSYVRGLKEKSAGLPIEFVPPIYGRVALAAELQAAHYYCYPSLADRGESSPVAPLEAMATGLAPIVSDLRCFRDYIEPGSNGLTFDYRGADAAYNLSKALREMATDVQHAEVMGQRAAVRAGQLSLSHVADMYLADFVSLLSNHE